MIKELELQLRDYAEELRDFSHQHNLSVFNRELDYIAVKPAGQGDFDLLIKEFMPMSFEITSVEQNNRTVATAQLLGSMGLLGFGTTQWVRLIQSKSTKKGNDKVGLDHVGFYRVDFEDSADALRSAGIGFRARRSDQLRYLEVKFGSNREVKLTNRPTFEVVADHKSRKQATIVKGPS